MKRITKEEARIWTGFILSNRVTCEIMPYGGHWLTISGTGLKIGLICNQAPFKIYNAHLRINGQDFNIYNEDAEVMREEFLTKRNKQSVIDPETINSFLI